MSTDPAGTPPDPYDSAPYSSAGYSSAGYGESPPYGTSGPIPDRSEAASKKLAAGLTGILLGAFGVHKFILGYTNAGIIMLAVTAATFIGTLATCGLTAPLSVAMGVIGLVEGIIYLTKSDDDFYQTYMVGKKEWF